MRIRTVKPEWLDDEALVLASADARVLSIALILLADDYGNGRANVAVLSGRVFPGKVPETLANALAELAKARFVVLYEADGQRYFSIRNWSKHQKVDKPGKPQVPGFTEFAKAIEAPENIRGTLATDQDQDQEVDREREPRARTCESNEETQRDKTRNRLVKGFQRRWEAARKAPWPGTKQNPEWDAAAKFIAGTAEMRGVTVESLATEALDSWFADEWVIAEKYPDTNFPKHIAKHIDKSPTSAAASPELASALEAQERAEEACRKARLYRDSVAGTEAHSEASRAHSAKQRELAMAKDRVEALSA